MKLPSLDYIFKKAFYVLKRFPFAMAAAALAGVIAGCLAEQLSNQPEYLFNILLAAILGIPLFTVLQFVSEKRDWNRSLWTLVNAAALAVLVFYYFLLPQDFDQTPAYHVYRYLLYLLGVHLLVSIGPFLGKDETNAFWQYNKTLFLRFLTSVLFSGVLFLGLAIALLSIDALLGVQIDDETYLQLFALLAFIFNTWFFLAGMPKSLDYFNRVDDYPKGLKIFTQNILIPLVIIYLAILYVYTGKILILWAWPEGWVSNLILSFSIVGIFAILLLYPIQNKLENRWIKRFSKSYFWSLVPLVILLLLAIWRRIWEYGFTIERYFVLILGLWLTGVVLYFIISKIQNIKLIPTSLCLIAFLISFGPWGAFSISEQSQTHRLQAFLKQNGILENGSIQPASGAISFEEQMEISSIVRYLVYNHGAESFQPWFEQDLSKMIEGDSTRTLTLHQKPQHIVELMGIEYVSRWQSRNAGQEVTHFSSTEQEAVLIEGYDWMIQDVYITSQDDFKIIDINGRKITIALKEELPALRIYLSNDSTSALTIDYGEMIQELQQKYSSKNYAIPPDEMSTVASNQNWMVKVYFHRIDWENDEQYMLLDAQFDLLISFKEQ
ncbi:MAG TPA: DUF4153 domain-containing protein [Balneolaceae bacterium]|nr:DUF4153 domain-containing protein [Balneolaceae bacterium]